MSADYYSYAYKDDPIVAGLISQSGVLGTLSTNTADTASSMFSSLASNLGCSSDALKCVRAASASEVADAAGKVISDALLPTSGFYPTIDNDIIFPNYTQLAKDGDFIHVPYLLGNNDYDAGWFRLAESDDLKLPDFAWVLFNQVTFTCPTATEAYYRTQHGVPTWRYRYHGDWGNLRLYNGSAGLGRSSGTWHGSEIPMVFGTAEDVSGLNNNRTEEETSSYMMKAWAAFVRDPSSGLSTYGWPEYDASGKSPFFFGVGLYIGVPMNKIDTF